ncbi:MAG: hypothetical protein ICV73_22100 [Acetobacteraceae bacterium]|nr:hypothetical protein [Acetobacteraceae bacterium]
MDIRLVRGRNQRLWVWTMAIVALSLIVWGSAFVLGDATMSTGKQVGAKANFGGERAQVVPMQSEAFESALPLEDRELGRRLRLTGTAESRTVRNAVWVRTANPRRWILVRVEPVPKGKTIRPFYPGSVVDVQGYLQKISRAEFDAWIDSLDVYLPRPTPGVKFGDLPDSGFIRIDSLFIRDYYISVRPEGLPGGLMDAPATPAPRPARAAPRTPPPPARDPLPEKSAPAAPATGTTPAPATTTPAPAQGPPPPAEFPPPDSGRAPPP